jgi:hypothetical protein
MEFLPLFSGMAAVYHILVSVKSYFVRKENPVFRRQRYGTIGAWKDPMFDKEVRRWE